MTNQKCPKCQSKNTKMVTDYSDNWHDLCIICKDCKYSEQEQKKLNEKQK